jgi:hypothetical protein
LADDNLEAEDGKDRKDGKEDKDGSKGKESKDGKNTNEGKDTMSPNASSLSDSPGRRLAERAFLDAVSGKHGSRPRGGRAWLA